MPDIVHSVPFVFYGETFKAYLASDRQWYIPINEVCGALDGGMVSAYAMGRALAGASRSSH